MTTDTSTDPVDLALIGGGIMSATLGAMLALLQPDWRVSIVERADDIATESSHPWNNAGTGHSGYCELNYMPDPADAGTPAAIAEQFALSRRWWAHLVDTGLLEPGFVTTAPHMDVVFGDRDIAYLRRRFDTLRTVAAFAEMRYSQDPAVIAEWAPLVMAGRDPAQRVAATWHPAGTDIDFGALTRDLARLITGDTLLGHEVRTLTRTPGGGWRIAGRCGQERFELDADRVFVGAGGRTLTLLQRAGLPDIQGYGVLPVGAAFLRCSDPEITRHHAAKVYGQAPIGAPPMSVPHLDRRVVDGDAHLLFGPYATFSTRLLTSGRITDFFGTVRPHNMRALIRAITGNRDLIRYLIGQLLASHGRRFDQLRRYYPDADPRDWEWVTAGQRAQLVAPNGALRTGTELVVSADDTIAGLLGASPGASTSVPIMIDLLRRWFPRQWESWRHRAEFGLLAS
ncbi:malate:quinone oxidoreductase [Arthrobacter sp. SLBN-53]|uniref:malate:quinone oxidoreductase n=1 Tax=Arthrobacter sp. SLBN-53 TaxID=2768412 RepID=UPI00114F6A60|nr:malate:quinone oxidoreductase [Arthrobacter sp. SLBN-53]TQK27777.1 malate dehydrogenase (quinone) [Arthrobacter sp. SLBN-53]